MRNTTTAGGVVCPETYHGTKMDQKALEFHTQLHEWSEAQKISAHANKHAQLLSNARQKEIYLPFKKLAQIEHWTKDVNRFYRPYKGGRPKSGNFMKIDVTKYNMKVDKSPVETRSKSAIYTTAASGNGYRVVSAMSTSAGSAQRRFFGTDFHSVKHKLFETQMHYSGQRREIRSATLPRPVTSAKTMDTKTDTDANLSLNMNGLDKVEPSESETLSISGNTSTKHSSIDSQGQGQIEADILQQKVTSRSYSNRMLNVISIDDCKLTCRFRPQTIKESRRLDSYSDDLALGKGKHKQISSTDGNNGKNGAVKSDLDKNESADEIEEAESNIKLDIRLNGMVIGDTSRDNNNNVDGETDQSSEEEEEDSTDEEHEDSASESNDQTPRVNDKTSKSKKKKKKAKKDSISFQENLPTKASNGSNGSKTGKETSSCSSNKTSYGRITSLYTHSNSATSRYKPNKKKKKQTRSAKINHAINDMVKDRRVMNAMDRDFDTRTAEFGRTVVDKSEGSEIFQKLHSNLRKKLDAFIDTHSAVKTMKYHEIKRKNSIQVQSEHILLSPHKDGI